MKVKGEQKGKIWLKNELKPYRGRIVFLAILTVFSVLFSLAFSYLLKDVVGSAQDGDKDKLILFSSVLVGIILLRVCCSVADSYLAEKYCAEMTIGFRSRIYGKILKAKYSEIEKYHSGDLLNRLTTDVAEVANDSIRILPAVVGLVAQFIGAFVALVVLDPLMTVVFTLAGALIGSVTAIFRKYIKKYHRETIEADGRSRAFMQESITSTMTVKAYGAETIALEKSKKILDEYFLKRMKKNRFRIVFNFGFSVAGGLSLLLAVVWCSVKMLKTGTNDFGSLLSIVMLLGQLKEPLSAFSAVLPVVYAREASAERLAQTDGIEEETNGVEKENYENIQSFLVKDLVFSYGEKQVFDRATAKTERGKIVCITGASGSGKSTLFKLILNMYPIEQGGVYLKTENGERKIGVQDRSLFAYVPQGNFLFSGTIKENLTFFTGEVSEEKIKEALSLAVADFVYELPNGLETELKERGSGLSEGQLQRLAIARALLSERDVLLLDEATSALDIKTEQTVLKNIRSKTGKTCFIITHRPAPLEIADVVWDASDGKITERTK